VTVKLEHLWTVGGDTEDEDEFFGVIADIEIDNSGNVYLLDSQLAEVKIYTKDGELIRTIGREGEGPGSSVSPTPCFSPKRVTSRFCRRFPARSPCSHRMENRPETFRCRSRRTGVSRSWGAGRPEPETSSCSSAGRPSKPGGQVVAQRFSGLGRYQGHPAVAVRGEDEDDRHGGRHAQVL